ncbi:hypothetical protein HYDPIDRAFT_118615 [Hydnomerulius pinastri MD-312]|uniref:Uncharacterized protein n=1 Tax=Hydnomerulius pinastri MD-312 TaxID=994086 RepID=A0A0C9V2B3_9AGAM|nr:hypothetical protein HYDPIDRAFT_118615 [Hydnomerulius pinastri MD-312]
MPWYSPPNRREISLILFSVSTFILFYNLESSFSHFGNDPEVVAATSRSGRRNSKLGAARELPTSWRDDWDMEIYGDWAWEEQQVAKNAQKREEKARNMYSSMKAPAPVSQDPRMFGTIGVNDGFVNWEDEIPMTSVIQHVPGYTILDNVFMINGTVFLVTDDPSFPSLGSVASSGENSHELPRPSDWQILSSSQARHTLGDHGGLIHGVSWLSTDASPSNYTLFSLWRTYSSLNTSLSVSDGLTLPPPRRIFYPNVPTFMGERPDLNGPIILRQRSPSGFHPFLAKAAFPTVGLMYKEDWEDFALMEVPFILRRVVVADQGAARRSRGDVPPFALPLVELGASKEWWEPIRRNVASFLGVVDQEPKKSWRSKTKTVITYLSRQDAPSGPKLKSADHEALVKALNNLGSGYIVNIIPSESPWTRRMTAVAQSTILIGLYGDHLADSVYMAPSAHSTLMEIFPPGTFTHDAEISVKSLGINYFAWWKAQQHASNSLPPVIPPTESQHSDIPIDASALVKAIRRIS